MTIRRWSRTRWTWEASRCAAAVASAGCDAHCARPNRTLSPRLPCLQEKLDANGYVHPKEFKHDVNLVWNNCMTYNAVSGCPWRQRRGGCETVCVAQRAAICRPAPVRGSALVPQDGSEYWMMAANLKRVFEEKYAKMVKDDGARAAVAARPVPLRCRTTAPTSRAVRLPSPTPPAPLQPRHTYRRRVAAPHRAPIRPVAQTIPRAVGAIR